MSGPANTMLQLYDELKDAATPCARVDWALGKLYDEVESWIRNPRPEDVAAWDAWEEMSQEERDAYRAKKIGAAEAAAIKREEEKGAAAKAYREACAQERRERQAVAR